MQTERNIWLKVLSMILTLALLISCVPNQVYAMAGEALESLLEQEEANAETIETPNETKRGVYEVTKLREANVKHFALEDGTYTAVMYGSAVHTQDADGNWQDIDNRLADSGSEFSTSNARIKFAKKITGNETLFTLHDGNRKITMSLNNAIKKTIGAVTNHTTEFDSEATQLQKLMTLDNLSSEILYADILDGVDLQYVVESLNVKENIIVKDRKDSYQYTFTIALNNLEAEMAEGGSVRIYDPSTKETVYNIPVGFMYDANGEYSTAVTYTLENVGNGKYSLTVTADADWINAADRAFPVVIDPTIELDDSYSYEATSIHPQTPNRLGNSDGYLAGGTQGIAYWKVTNLPTLPAGSYITNALFAAESQYPESLLTLELGVYKVISNWSPYTFCYAQYEAKTAGQLAEYAYDVQIDKRDDDPFVVWNVTQIVSEWYNTPSENYGLAIHCTEPDTDNMQYYFTCGTIGSPLCITYKTIQGIEEYWSYTTQSVRLAGNGYINNATGKLNFSIGTLTATDSLFAYAPTLIWDQDFAGNYVENGLEGRLGYGFRINMYETITTRTYVNSNNEEITYYTWTDWDGTTHDFYPNDTEAGVFCDDDGMQLTLKIENNQYVISDRNHTRKVFSSSGILNSIEDRNSNQLVFVYNGNRITSIQVVPNGYAAFTALTFQYNGNGLLYAVTNSYANQTVKFYYSPSKSSSNASISSYGYLMKAVRTEQNVTTVECYYEYDTSGRLVSAYDPKSNYEVRYAYVDGLVCSATEYVGSTFQRGQKVELTYRDQYCEVRSSGSDDVWGNTDDIINVYIFDANGRVTSAYSTDASRTIIYGASSGEYETEDNIKNNIKSSITVGGAASNYILNGDFDGMFVTGTPASYWHKTGNVSDVSASSEVHDHYSARFSLVKDTFSSLQQLVFLPEGEYTLSVDVEAQYATDVEAYLLVESQNNSAHRFSQEIPLDETTVVKNSLTVSLNFNAVNYNLSGGEEFLVWIIVECGSHPNSSGYIVVDNVMLEEGIGHSGYSMVEFGNFEDTSVAWSHGVSTTWSQVWETEGTVVYENSLLGNVLKVDTPIDDSHIVAKQPIYQAIGSTYNSTAKSFIISGMAKGTQQYASGDFCIELYIDYVDVEIDDVSVYLPFQQASTEWQFVSKSFTTLSEEINEIEIRLIYDNPGVAYFDNIYVTQVVDDFSTKTEYYSNGLVQKQKNSYYEETYIYDSNGNVIELANSHDERYVYTYNQNNNVTKIQFYAPDENGDISLRTTTEYFYNSIGKITSQYTYDGSSLSYAEHYVSASYSYDMDPTSRTFGALKHETDNKGTRTFHFYDPDNGRLLASVNADAGTGNCYTYDSAGRTTSVRPATFSWDHTDEYGEVTNSAQVSYSYNAQNLLEKITTLTSEYTFYYDGFGNTDSVEIGGSEIISYDYNSYNGKLKTVTYASGFVVKYTYDELENLSEVWYNDGGEDYLAYKYLYNAYGQIYRFENHLSNVHIIYDYDASNRLIGYVEYGAEDMVNHFAVTYSYNDDSRVQFIQYSFDYLEGFYGLSNSRVSYTPTYDKDGTVKSFHVATPIANGTIHYGYDVYDRLENKTQSFLYGSNTYQSGMTYEYAGKGSSTQPTTALIEKVTSTVMGNSLEYTYEYNDRNQITKITMSNGRVNRYYYDDLGQLTQEDVAGLGMTYTYTYDKAGNILSKSYYAYTEEGATPSNPLYVYSYGYGDENWGDKLRTYRGQGISYDVIGNPLSYYNGTRWNFTWQSGRQLATATAGSKTCSFTYNDSGIRTSKTVNGTTHTYYLDGDRIIAEEWNGIVLVFLYDDNNSPIGMLYRNSQDETGEFEVFWYEKNVQGDIVAVYDGASNKLINYVYDAFGNFYEGYSQANANSHARLNPFRYRGYYYDTDLKMYYLQSRYYDPAIGRFINPDKFATTGQGVLSSNMFAYCANDPVNYVDDEGTYYIWFVLKKTGNWGFIHRCVEEEIKKNYGSSILTEVVIPKYVPYLDRTVNYRADIVNSNTGNVWEIKHAGTNPQMRKFIAQFQALHYINGNYTHEGNSGTTSGLGSPGVFLGTFYIDVGTIGYRVDYYTPAHGAILYTITELGNKYEHAYAYSYSIAYAEVKEKSTIYESPGITAPVFSAFVFFPTFAGSGGVTAIYGGHNWLMKPKFETS